MQRLQEWGYAAEMLPASAVLADLEPGLAIPDPETPVAWFPAEGWVDAPAMTRRLVEAVRNAGAGMAVRAEMPDGSDPLRRPMETDHIAVRPDGPGRVFLALPVDAETDLADMPPGPIPLDDPLVAQVMAWGVEAVPALAAARPVEALIGVRPIPADGLPSVGAVPGIPGYFEAVTHSGVTLAPLIARSLADEMLGQPGNPLFQPFRPERFTPE